MKILPKLVWFTSVEFATAVRVTVTSWIIPGAILNATGSTVTFTPVGCATSTVYISRAPTFVTVRGITRVPTRCPTVMDGKFRSVGNPGEAGHVAVVYAVTLVGVINPVAHMNFM